MKIIHHIVLRKNYRNDPGRNLRHLRETVQTIAVQEEKGNEKKNKEREENKYYLVKTS